MTRAPKAVWSDYDTELLKWAVSMYEHRHVNYNAVALLFDGRTALDVKRRCAVLRDRVRRQERLRELCGLVVEPCVDPPIPNDVLQIPRPCQLHPELVWVAAEWHDLETLKL
tara:strand:- start:236 stop:571 length:336 start_codon:yes stop_codon:yes gene_type:complete